MTKISVPTSDVLGWEITYLPEDSDGCVAAYTDRCGLPDGDQPIRVYVWVASLWIGDLPTGLWGWVAQDDDGAGTEVGGPYADRAAAERAAIDYAREQNGYEPSPEGHKGERQ